MSRFEGVNAVACEGCTHPFGLHDRTTKATERNACNARDAAGLGLRCACQKFAWGEVDEDPESSWDDYKSGYTDIDGNVLEPSNKP